MLEALPPIGADTTKEEWEAAMHERDLRIADKKRMLIMYLTDRIMELAEIDAMSAVAITVWADGTVEWLDKDNAGGSND